MEKWNSEIDALKIDAQRARAETKVEFEKRIRQLHKKCEAARDKIEQIQASEDVPFEEIKAGAEQMWNGIKQLLIDTKAEFKKGVQEANPVLLEPIMKMEITIPEDSMGDVIGDVNARRGKVSGVDSLAGSHLINALIPMSEVLTYAPELRSITSGRGSFTMDFSHYEEVPNQEAQKIIQEASSGSESEE